MGHEIQKRLIPALFLLILALRLPLSAQDSSERKDSLVRLMNARSLQLIEKAGNNYRKAVDATFLHNGTYLICDTALWNVEQRLINAYGHVQVIQDETRLTGDRLDYVVDENLAKFRGSVVQLQDKDMNVLRTMHLDYNTKDSVALFKEGGAMLSADGQIIESDDGKYETAYKRFTFTKNVNMFADSIFVKTSSLVYETEPNKAEFHSDVDFWKDGNMLSASKGWYDRPAELFFFRGNVHGTTEKQEAWSDTLYYYRRTNDLKMFGRAQIQDSTRNIIAVADKVFYKDSLARVTMVDDAAVAMQTGEKEKIDTIYFGADTLKYRTVRKCDISAGILAEAAARVAEISIDAVAEYRIKAAKEAEEAAARAEEENPDPNRRLRKEAMKKDAARQEKEAEDEVRAPEPEVKPAQDTLKTIAPPDTSRVGFFLGRGNVRIFRKDIQARCDSMLYNDLDSIARFYVDPIIWNEGNRQYTSDSLFALVRNGRMDRASLMSNAFIVTKESENCYDQIKGTEVMAYFDEAAALKRFDALGGAAALFFLEENETLATVNKVQSKMLSAVMKNGTVDKVHYFEAPKNDAYPVAQLPETERYMKGFNWNPDSRPAGKEDVTTLEVKPSERTAYAGHPKADFKQMARFFRGHMDEVYKAIARSDSLRRIPKPAPTDTLSASDTVRNEAPGIKDSTSVRTPADSLAKAEVRDSVTVSKEDVKSERRRAREARWAELDARDAARAEARAQKKLERKRATTRKAVLSMRRQDAIDKAKKERYKAMFEKKKLREEARKLAKDKKTAERQKKNGKTADNQTTDNKTTDNKTTDNKTTDDGKDTQPLP